jgi:hypothetical protein
VGALVALVSGWGSSASSTQLRIDLTGGAFGPRSYTLRCLPTGGTFPRAEAACSAIASDEGLLVSHPGREHSCPFGPPRVHVTGRSDGRKVDARFSVCTSGQEGQAARWIEFADYGPWWIMQTSGQTDGAQVSIRLNVAPTVNRSSQSGVVTDVRLSPHSSGSASVFRARGYPGFRKPVIVTRVKPNTYVLSVTTRECLKTCNRLSLQSTCALRFPADKAKPSRLDVRVKPNGDCLVQIEQHRVGRSSRQSGSAKRRFPATARWWKAR